MTSANAVGADMPRVPVSWGELLDKITILEIKCERIADPAAVANVRRELDLLAEVRRQHGMDNPEALSFATRLKAVNRELWDIEDGIREKEREGAFDDGFVQLARSVYLRNDERAAIKRAINQRFACGLVEEKSYHDYARPGR